MLRYWWQKRRILWISMIATIHCRWIFSHPICSFSSNLSTLRSLSKILQPRLTRVKKVWRECCQTARGTIKFWLLLSRGSLLFYSRRSSKWLSRRLRSLSHLTRSSTKLRAKIIISERWAISSWRPQRMEERARIQRRQREGKSYTLKTCSRNITRYWLLSTNLPTCTSVSMPRSSLKNIETAMLLRPLKPLVKGETIQNKDPQASIPQWKTMARKEAWAF